MQWINCMTVAWVELPHWTAKFLHIQQFCLIYDSLCELDCTCEELAPKHCCCHSCRENVASVREIAVGCLQVQPGHPSLSVCILVHDCIKEFGNMNWTLDNHHLSAADVLHLDHIAFQPQLQIGTTIPFLIEVL